MEFNINYLPTYRIIFALQKFLWEDNVIRAVFPRTIYSYEKEDTTTLTSGRITIRVLNLYMATRGSAITGDIELEFTLPNTFNTTAKSKVSNLLIDYTIMKLKEISFQVGDDLKEPTTGLLATSIGEEIDVSIIDNGQFSITTGIYINYPEWLRYVEEEGINFSTGAAGKLITNIIKEIGDY